MNKKYYKCSINKNVIVLLNKRTSDKHKTFLNILKKYLAIKYDPELLNVEKREYKKTSYISREMNIPRKMGELVDNIKGEKTFNGYCNDVVFNVLLKYDKRKNNC